MVWGGRREEGSGWGTHVYLWQIHFDIWQNQNDILKSKNKIKKIINKTNYLQKKKKMKRFHTSKLAAKSNHTCLTRLYMTVLFPLAVMEPGSGNNCEASTVIGADLWLCRRGQAQHVPLIAAPFMLYLSA